MIFTPQTIQLFESLLNSYNLPASSPDFDQLASVISAARSELNFYHTSDSATPKGEINDRQHQKENEENKP